MSSKMRNNEASKTAFTFRAASSVTDVAVSNFFSSLDCPRSLACWLLYSSGEFQQLLNLETRVSDYDGPASFRDAYTATLFLSKADFLNLDVSREDVAIAKFLKFEEQCQRTNHRFKFPLSDPQLLGPNVWLLNATKRKIEVILGDFCCEELVDAANWGPGVTTLTKGEHVSATNKFHCENGMTHELYSFVSPWFSEAYPLWADWLESQHGPQLFARQEGNQVITVPKNSKTDRVIAIEPGVNLWFQKGIGSMIRRRLSRSGIDLNSQERNQQLAKRSSLDDSLATVDFSSASDSISFEVVRELLPPRWFSLLNATRSKNGVIKGTSFRWMKFSSMGNGFTFELESLIFFAAACAVLDFLELSTKDVSVFGDDVIIPSGAFNLYSSFTEFLGFTVNQEKSFSLGCFRESCGAHYYDGLDCKPLFLKERLQNAQSFYKLANGIRRLAHRHNFNCGCDSRFRISFNHLRSGVPKSLRFGIPDGVGDGGFIGNFDEATPVLAHREGIFGASGYEGYLVRCVIETGIRQYFEGDGLLFARLWGIPKGSSSLSRKQSDQAYGNYYTLRGRTRMKVKNILVPRWYNLGEWT